MKSQRSNIAPSRRQSPLPENGSDLNVAFVGNGFDALNSLTLPKVINGHSVSIQMLSDPKLVPAKCDGVVYLSDTKPTNSARFKAPQLSQSFANFVSELRERSQNGQPVPLVHTRVAELTDKRGRLKLNDITQVVNEECGNIARAIYDDGDPFRLEFASD